MQIGHRFVKLVRRELKEISPYPLNAVKEKPWWEHLTKRFVHKKFLTLEGISEHRDFVLSLDPTLVYLVTQLWSSYEEHDGEQWKHYLGELARNRKVRSKGLREAAARWENVVPRAPEGSRPSGRTS